MIVLGILLLLLGLAIAVFVLLSGVPPTAESELALELFGLRVETSAVVMFALGALSLLLLELGILAARSGARKSAKRRSELQRLRRVEQEVQTRQAAQAQRNAEVAPPAAAPFARRDTTAEARRDGDPDGDRSDTGEGADRDRSAGEGATAADRDRTTDRDNT